MKIVVTGAAGFIGFFLSKRLLEDGQKVIGVDNFFRGKKENILYLENFPNFKFIQADLTRDNITKIFHGTDTVYHLAAVNGTKHFYDNPVIVLNTNVVGTINVLEACRHNNIKKFIFASSSEVYHNADKIPTPETEKIWIENTTNPRFTYAASKIIGEMYSIWLARRYNFDYIITRIFNSYGPRMDTSEYGQVIPEFIRKMFKDKIFTIIGNGKQKRSFCYIDDTVEMLIRSSKLKNIILNIGNSKEVTMLELAKNIFKIAGKKFVVNKTEAREGDVIRRVPDMTRTKRLLKYTPKVSLDEGLRKTISWYEKRI